VLTTSVPSISAAVSAAGALSSPAGTISAKCPTIINDAQGLVGGQSQNDDRAAGEVQLCDVRDALVIPAAAGACATTAAARLAGTSARSLSA
jgi:hypothetical protein